MLCITCSEATEACRLLQVVILVLHLGRLSLHTEWLSSIIAIQVLVLWVSLDFAAALEPAVAVFVHCCTCAGAPFIYPIPVANASAHTHGGRPGSSAQDVVTRELYLSATHTSSGLPADQGTVLQQVRICCCRTGNHFMPRFRVAHAFSRLSSPACMELQSVAGCVLQGPAAPQQPICGDCAGGDAGGL